MDRDLLEAHKIILIICWGFLIDLGNLRINNFRNNIVEIL